MKRTICSLFALMLCALPSTWAQGFVDDSKKLWIDGPLTLDDFDKRNVDKEEKELSSLWWDLSFELQKKKEGNLLYNTVFTETSMDRLRSWYSPQALTPWTLRYNQAIFDRVEVIRCHLQNELNANPAKWSEIHDYYKRYLINELEKFEQESRLGADTAAILRMEEQNREDLENFKEEPARIPDIVKPKWGGEIWIGYDGEYFGTPMADGVTMSNCLAYGLSVYYDKFNIEAGIRYGSCGKLKTDNFYYDEKYDHLWQKGEKCSLGGLWLSGGFRAIDKPYYALRPMVGFGTTNLFLPKEEKSDGPDGLRLMAGLCFDYKFKRMYNTFSGSYLEDCISFRLFGSRTNFSTIGETYSINFGVSVSIIDWGNFRW